MGPMFNSYEMTTALVAERQETLRHEARRHHRVWGRRVTRGAATTNVTRLAAPEDPAPSGPTTEDRLAA
jgi:hypothetical protein